MEKYTYFLVDFFTIIFPLFFSFTKWYNFKDYWKFFLGGNLVIALFYIIWDVFFTHLGVWGFDLKYTLGVSVFGLPLEELFFFICIPYSSTFTYFCFKKYYSRFFKDTLRDRKIIEIVGVFSIVFSMFNFDKYYTASAFGFLGIVLILLSRLKFNNFRLFFAVFTLILIPFFITNGILTGGYLDRIVVFYNPSHFLGIRMGTIPLEDTFYGMSLLLLNIYFFELSLSKNNKTIS